MRPNVTVQDVEADLITAIRQDPSAYYVNVHSRPNFPGGAVRGQLASTRSEEGGRGRPLRASERVVRYSSIVCGFR